MRKDIAERWVAALRSYKYKQGKYFLRNKDDKFCCLGVLCDLHAQDHPHIAAKQRSARVYLRETKVLPAQVRNWAEMESPKGAPRNLGSVRIQGVPFCSLAGANDSNASFKQIAAWIEQNYMRL